MLDALGSSGTNMNGEARNKCVLFFVFVVVSLSRV